MEEERSMSSLFRRALIVASVAACRSSPGPRPERDPHGGHHRVPVGPGARVDVRSLAGARLRAGDRRRGLRQRRQQRAAAPAQGAPMTARLAAGLALAILATASPAYAAQAPVRSCSSLSALDLGRVDARVESAAQTTTNGVAFCQVQGYISPQTHFTVLLPQTTWRGSYLQQG